MQMCWTNINLIPIVCWMKFTSSVFKTVFSHLIHFITFKKKLDHSLLFHTILSLALALSSTVVQQQFRRSHKHFHTICYICYLLWH